MQGLQLANQETTTPLWFALRLGQTTFAIFDAFRDEAGRQAHLNGPIAKALMAQAPHLLATPPVIERMEVLGAKVPKEKEQAA
jgi:quinol monooxygenase YgiN